MSLDSLEGDLQQIRLTRVLFLLGVQEANGILTVQGEDDIVAVSFVQGAIVTADALNQTVEDGLGKVLQGKGWVNADLFNAAAREHQGGATGSLGDLLVEKGLVTRQQLLEALRLQTLRSMLQLLTWKTGDFKFYSGDEVSFEDGFVPIGVEELILRALSKLGERAGLMGSMPDDQLTYRQVPPRGPVKIIGRDGDGMDAGIWLSPLQAAFLGKINGQTPTADIARSQGLNRQQLLYALYHLTQFDLIESSGRKPAAVAPPQPGLAAAPPAAGTIPFADEPSGGAAGPGAAGSGAAGPAAAGLGAAPGLAGAGGQPIAPGASGQTNLGPTTNHSGVMLRPSFEPSGSVPRPTIGDPSGTVPRPATGSGIAPRTAAGTQAEVFRPPDPSADEALDESFDESEDRILEWAGTGLAAVLLAGVFLALSSRPAALLLPFPWQENVRNTVERQVRESLFRRIDRGARTFFLMEAHYPDTLSELRDLGLISAVDLKGPAGYELEYSSEEVSYSIQLRENNQLIEGLGTKEAITGDFLVDPQFLGTAATAEDPVVLLD